MNYLPLLFVYIWPKPSQVVALLFELSKSIRDEYPPFFTFNIFQLQISLNNFLFLVFYFHILYLLQSCRPGFSRSLPPGSGCSNNCHPAHVSQLFSTLLLLFLNYIFSSNISESILVRYATFEVLIGSKLVLLNPLCIILHRHRFCSMH